MHIDLDRATQSGKQSQSLSLHSFSILQPLAGSTRPNPATVPSSCSHLHLVMRRHQQGSRAPSRQSVYGPIASCLFSFIRHIPLSPLHTSYVILRCPCPSLSLQVTAASLRVDSEFHDVTRGWRYPTLSHPTSTSTTTTTTSSSPSSSPFRPRRRPPPLSPSSYPDQEDEPETGAAGPETPQPPCFRA